MRFAIFCFSFILFAISSYASRDTIVVYKDARLDILTSKQAAANKLTAKMTSNGQYKGFRLQVLTSRSRDEAFKTKSDLLQMFPYQKVYVLYQSPYFKVRIGNFVQKSDASAFRIDLAKLYPQNAYVVEDIIDYTPKDEEEDPAAN